MFAKKVLLAALAASGTPADEFVFAGFAPSRSTDRKRWLQALAHESRTVIFFEAPHRISKTLTAMGEVLVDRPIIIARELTKLHEEILHTTARDASALKLNERGEFTIVLAPYIKTDVDSEPVDDSVLSSYFYQLTNSRGLSRRQAVTATAREFGLSPNDVYDRLERQKT